MLRGQVVRVRELVLLFFADYTGKIQPAAVVATGGFGKFNHLGALAIRAAVFRES